MNGKFLETIEKIWELTKTKSKLLNRKEKYEQENFPNDINYYLLKIIKKYYIELKSI